MTKNPYPPFAHQWDTIEAQIAGGATVEKRNIAAALRHATPEIDNIIALLHSRKVAALLQIRRIALNDDVVTRLFDALEALLMSPVPVVPAAVQHHIADLLDPPARPAGRPKFEPTPMRLVQLEIGKRKKAEGIVEEISRLLAHHRTKADALDAYARQVGVTPAQAKRVYRDAIKILQAARTEQAELLSAAAKLLAVSEAELLSRHPEKDVAPPSAK